MRNTRFAVEVDPDPKKEMMLDSLEILVRNADIIFHGGTPNESFTKDEKIYTEKSMKRIVSLRTGGRPLIYIFPGSPSQVVAGADQVLYLFIPNSTDTFFGWGVQLMSIDDALKKYPMKKVIHCYMKIKLMKIQI